MDSDAHAPLEQLQHAISDILLAQVTPVSEFELIRTLQREPYELLSERALRGSLSLFQTHFLVFHCLYQLRDEWRAEQLCDLRIEPLAIGCEPLAGHQGQQLPAAEDKLRAYYLDMGHFDSTSSRDVDDLLSGFWQDFGRPAPAVHADERSQAMMIMDLETMPESQRQLKRLYRQQVHQKHPDKGGATEAMHSLQWAYQVLSQVLRHGISTYD
ncbi:DNA-J related domain-containing protein [Aliidiomarina sp. Khilg15.8]